MRTILSHANLIDCVAPKVRPDSAVLIEDGRIRAILPTGEASNAGDAQVIDLKGGYLMPGLWDVHIHPDYLSLDEMPLAEQVTLFGHRLAASSRAARISSSSRNEWVCRSQAGPMMPPDRLSLMWSTPFLICSRMALTQP